MDSRKSCLNEIDQRRQRADWNINSTVELLDPSKYCANRWKKLKDISWENKGSVCSFTSRVGYAKITDWVAKESK
jgi:hypothetical protein